MKKARPKRTLAQTDAIIKGNVTALEKSADMLEKIARTMEVTLGTTKVVQAIREEADSLRGIARIALGEIQ